MSARLVVGAAAFAIAFAGAREGAAHANEPAERTVTIVVDPTAAAAPAAAPAEAEQPADRGARPPPWRVFAAFTASGGATTLRLLGLSFNGGQALVGASAEASEHLSLGADLAYARASTPNGLLMQVGRLELTPTFVLGRVRLGLGVQLTRLSITRETRRDDDITTLGVGLHAQLSVDLVRVGVHGGLFLAVKPSIETAGPTSVLSGDLAAGIRF